MAFKRLISVMIIQRSNFQALHWKLYGKDFDNMHANVTNNYYEMVTDDIDDVVESVLRLGINPPTPIEAMKICLSDGDNECIYSTDRNYDRDEAVMLCDKSLKAILDAIIDVLEMDDIQNNIKNVGIKSYLESLYDKYDKEYRFLNRKRMKFDK